MIEYLGSPLAVLFFVGVSLLRGDAVSPVWILAGWDLYAGVWLAFAWVFVIHMTPERTRQWANRRSQSVAGLARVRSTPFVLTASVAVLSLFGLLFGFVLFSLASAGGTQGNLHAFVLSGAAIVLSWLSLNTAFTLHYASLSYRDRAGAPGDEFKFAGDETPTMLDFAYFAFTVGTTFGTSDVDVTSNRARKQVLVHTLVSFWFTTGVLAFIVNFAVSYG